MEKIKNQISAIVVFKGATFRELDEEWHSIGNLLIECLQKMKNAEVFSDSEIEEVKNYAFNLKRNRFDQVRQALRDNFRNNFEF